MTCPACGDRRVGRLASGRYFCRECCVEFEPRGGNFRMYRLDDEGELIRVDLMDLSGQTKLGGQSQ